MGQGGWGVVCVRERECFRGRQRDTRTQTNRDIYKGEKIEKEK